MSILPLSSRAVQFLVPTGTILMGIYFPEKSFATRGIYFSRIDF